MSNPVKERKAQTREMIFQAAGISTGCIYAHFKDKRDLYQQILRENLDDLRNTLQVLSHTQTPGDVRQLILQWKPAYVAFFDYVKTNPEQVLLIVRGGFGVDEEHDLITWELFNAFDSDIAEDFRK